MVFLVIARPGDVSAESLVSGWGPLAAAMVVPADLSKSGWHLDPQVALGSQAVVMGERVGEAHIEGVVTLITGLCAEDLPHVSVTDRAYVAAEMSAFLWSFLAGLRCPVVNRPVEGSLSGPVWPAERWAMLAAAAGVPVWPLRRDTGSPRQDVPEPSLTETRTVTVVGGRAVGAADPTLADYARTLATTVGVELLTVEFGRGSGGFAVIGVAASPDLRDQRVGVAVREFLMGRVA